MGEQCERRTTDKCRRLPCYRCQATVAQQDGFKTFPGCDGELHHRSSSPLLQRLAPKDILLRLAALAAMDSLEADSAGAHERGSDAARPLPAGALAMQQPSYSPVDDATDSGRPLARRHPRLGRLPHEVEEEPPPAIMERFRKYMSETIKVRGASAQLGRAAHYWGDTYYSCAAGDRGCATRCTEEARVSLESSCTPFLLLLDSGLQLYRVAEEAHGVSEPLHSGGGGAAVPY